MTTSNCEYWPFAVAPTKECEPLESQQIDFLSAAHAAGYESFRFGINDVGARSGDREGCILQRGRTLWEIRLAHGESRSLLAFVSDFSTARAAIQRWLQGSCAPEIVQGITDRLVTPPGAKASFHLTGANGDLPSAAVATSEH